MASTLKEDQLRAAVATVQHMKVLRLVADAGERYANKENASPEFLAEFRALLHRKRTELESR